MPRSTYYYYVKKGKVSDKYTKIKEEIRSIYHENHGRYGYRRITLELHNRGYSINHKTVQRLMKSLGIKCMVRIKNIVHIKERSERLHPISFKEIFLLRHQIRNGLRISLSSLCSGLRYTFHQYLICLMAK